jgi:AraC-like DNA-binding protein
LVYISIHAEKNPLKNTEISCASSYGKAKCEIGWKWNPQPLTDYDLWYPVSGKGVMSIDGETIPIQKGRCFLVRPGDQPLAVQDLNDRLIVIFIHFNITDLRTQSSFNPDLLPERYADIDQTYEFESQLNRILYLFNHNLIWKDDEFDCIMKQLIMQMYRIQLQEKKEHALSPKQIQLISKVMDYIQQEGGRRISHKQLGETFQITAQYLSVLFKKYKGISLKEYITEVRLERAMHLLTETNMNISQVAEVLEYSNIYFFSRQFKQRYGYPPSHFQYKGNHTKPHL